LPICILIVAHSSSMQAAQRPTFPGPGAPPHVGQVSPAAALTALAGVAWGVSSSGAGVSHMDMLCSSRASCRRLGGLRCGLGRGARGRIDDVLDAPDAPDSEGKDHVAEEPDEINA